ncbi:MAG: hypothetical protein WAX44_00125 [Minisyncoccia bacterium]
MSRRFKKTEEQKVPDVKPEGFNPDAVLNNGKFVEFLAKHPDTESFDVSDESALEKRYVAFKSYEKVAEDLTRIYSGEIRETLGVALEGGDLDSVKVHIENMAISNPEDFEKLQASLKLFEELPGQIKTLEESLAQIAKVSPEDLKKLSELREEKADLGLVAKHLKKGKVERLVAWARGGEEYANLQDVLESVKKKYLSKDITPERIDVFIKEITDEMFLLEGKILRLDEVEKSKEAVRWSLDEARARILDEVSDIDGIADLVTKKTEEQLRALYDDGTMKSLDDAQVLLEKAVDGGEDNVIGLDPLGQVEDLPKLQEQIDKKIERKAGDEIRKAIVGLKLGDGALSRLTESLSTFIDRKKLGSKDEEQTKKFITDVVSTVVETFLSVSNMAGRENEAKAKRILCAQIIAKINKK